MSCEAHNFVFNVTDENKTFAIAISGCCEAPERSDKLSELLELYENDIKLHVRKVFERRHLLETSGLTYHLGAIKQNSPK